MELKLGEGIGDLRFGMTEDQCCDVLGKPDHIVKNMDDETILLFNDHKVSLTFYVNESNKLGYIRTSNKELNFQGKELLGEKITDVKEKIFQGIVNDWELERNEFFTTHSNDDHWIVVQEEYEAITAIELGVPFADDDSYDWPNK